MKAMINNQVLDVRMINSNYNDHAKEVEIIEGTFKGNYCIVENHDFIVEKPVKKNYRYYVQRNDFDYITGKWTWKLYAKAETYEEAMKKINNIMYNNAGDKMYRIFDRMEREYK